MSEATTLPASSFAIVPIAKTARDTLMKTLSDLAEANCQAFSAPSL
jgi:hypothetical protein